MAGCLYPKENRNELAPEEDILPQGDWSKEEEDKLRWKLDTRILMTCFWMIGIGYLDRINVSNARVLNSGKEDQIEAYLGLAGTQWNAVVSIYGVGLFICEPFSNFLMKKVSPTLWFSRIMITWGIITMCQAAVTNFAGLMCTRFFLGVAEAGLLPGVTLYMSLWYTQAERGVRMGIAYMGQGTMGCVAGFLAVAIQNMNGLGNLRSWQWLFLLEGIPAVLLGIAIVLWLPSSPQTADKLLTAREKEIAIRRLPPSAPSMVAKITSEEIITELKDPVMWLFFFSMLCTVIPIAGAAALLPSILQGIGFTTVTMANAGSAIVNGVAAFVTFFMTLHSDWTRERYWHVLVLLLVFTLCGSMPLVITATNNSLVPPIGRLFFVIITAWISGTYPIVWAYRANTAKGTGRSVLNSAITITAYAGGLTIGPQMFPSSDAPNYVPGLATSLGLYVAGGLIFAVIPFVLRWQMKNEPVRAVSDVKQPEKADV